MSYNYHNEPYKFNKYLLIINEIDLDDVITDCDNEVVEEWAVQRKTEDNTVDVVCAITGRVVYSI